MQTALERCYGAVDDVVGGVDVVALEWGVRSWEGWRWWGRCTCDIKS